MSDLGDLIGDDLTPEEEARLRRVHELLVQAGPPPDLPPALQQLPAPRQRWRLPALPRLRLSGALALAVASVAVAFGVGFLIGDRGGFPTDRVIAMQPTSSGPATAIASIDVGEKDEAGNWPLLLHVTRLPQQPEGKYYELWLTRNGKPVATCGTFRVESDQTTVRLNAPYKLKAFDGWVVTTDDRSRVLLTT